MGSNVNIHEPEVVNGRGIRSRKTVAVLFVYRPTFTGLAVIF